MMNLFMHDNLYNLYLPLVIDSHMSSHVGLALRYLSLSLSFYYHPWPDAMLFLTKLENVAPIPLCLCHFTKKFYQNYVVCVMIKLQFLFKLKIQSISYHNCTLICVLATIMKLMYWHISLYSLNME